MKVIVGLGNPGREYENTKHNMGFQTIDILAENLGIRVSKLKFRALTGEGRIGTEKIILVKPQTYMNLSGESVREIVQFYKIEPEDLVVIYDDIDLPIGTLRIRPKGSAGTHNGMRSIVGQLGDDQFPRIRIGIGTEKRGDLADFVLSGFRKEEVKTVEDTIRKAADAAVCIVEEDVRTAMDRFNTKKAKKKKEKPEPAENAAAGDPGMPKNEPDVVPVHTESDTGEAVEA